MGLRITKSTEVIETKRGRTCPIHGAVACEACGEASDKLTPVTDHGVTLNCCERCK